MNKLIKFPLLLIASFMIIIIKLYQFFISPLIGPTCRFQPTCSEYTILSIKENGLLIGIYKSIKRILSCHPLGKKGYDPVTKDISD